jgi:phosphotriesterase-related protein
MATINSVLGPLDTANLGFTLSHEHVLVSSAGIPTLYPEFLDLPKRKEDIVASLTRAYAEGVRTIIDCSPIDLGRDVPLMQEVSRRSRVNIIASTGVWTQIPRAFNQATPDQLASLFTREIRVGMQGTNAKAGVIKVANDEEHLRPEEVNILRGAARAAKATGAPVTTHSGHSWMVERVGVLQVKVFEEEGLNLNQVYIGHSDSTKNMDYLMGLARKGVWLGMDTIRGGPARPGTDGNPGNPDWEEKTAILKKLMDAGFTDRLMLGHDWSTYSTNAQGERDVQKQKNNPDGYLFITRKVLPRLKQLGASEKQVHQLMVDNPRRFFEGAK